MYDLLAKKIRCHAPKMTKLESYKHKNKFLRKVISTESEANTLHFLPLLSKIALDPPIFELDF